MERLDKVLSDSGIGTRKEIKKIIKDGRVRVNGIAASSPELKITPGSDTVTLDGNPVNTAKFRYFVMNKPSGILTATEDRTQKTVLDLLPPELKRLDLAPVGRLDKDTTGLLLLSNDGEFAHRVISPKSDIYKRYMAVTDGIPDESDAAAFKDGIVLRDGLQCKPALLELTGTSVCYVSITEGKYHQVKRMLASRGKPVTELKRLSIGNLTLDESLLPGQVLELEYSDLCNLIFVH